MKKKRLLNLMSGRGGNLGVKIPLQIAINLVTAANIRRLPLNASR